MGKGQCHWVIPDGYLPEKSTGDQRSHEAVCILNTSHHDAEIRLTLYFEDREPMEGFLSHCGSRRTHHIRLDRIETQTGEKIPVGVPYAVEVHSSVPVIVQHSRLDTSQEALALFTTMAYRMEE